MTFIPDYAMDIIAVCVFPFVLIFQLISVCLSQADPCTNYQLISMVNGFRSSDFYSRDSTVSICDSNVNIDTWYRFDHDSGSRLLEGPIGPWHCGTQAPIWLNGTHPTDLTEKIVEVCASYSAQRLCHWKGFIRIKMCTMFGRQYFVYVLTTPPGCPLAYCVDAASRKQCIPPKVWINSEFRCGVPSTVIPTTPESTRGSSSWTRGTTVTAGPGWGEWGPWSVCSKECDYGLQSRRRICDQLPCDGAATSDQLCNEYNCKTNPDELNKGIALTLNSFDPAEDSLIKVVQTEQIIVELLRNSLNIICSQNVPLCCGENYQGISKREVEFVTSTDIYPAQGVLHENHDKSVFYQIIAVVNEAVVSSVCKGNSKKRRGSSMSGFPKVFLPYETMVMGLVNSSDRILQNTYLVVVNQQDPALLKDYSDDNSDCPAATCIVPIALCCLITVVSSALGLVIYFIGKTRPGVDEPVQATKSPPPALNSVFATISSRGLAVIDFDANIKEKPTETEA